MQVSLGDRAAGFAPWAGGGESWICWRYSHARPVAALLLAGGPLQLAQADFELAYRDDASGEFAPVQLRRSAAGGDLDLDVEVALVQCPVQVKGCS